MPTSERLQASLADRYRIERELGEGGMATVYLAEDLKHKRQVALKVLKPELGAALGAERFINEIRTTANLQHPNLLPLFDSGEADGLLFYVMPYVEGETLRHRLEALRQLPVDETVRVVSLVAGALDFAHARGVVHRDLKPENILLQAGQPIIADFGIALAVAEAGGERVTQTGLSLGTPHYMSPEQAAGSQTVDARSDQYALAATAYEMLTGEPPHTGPTTPVIVARLMAETPRDIRATRPAVPAAVDAAIQRALSKSPADRYLSCGAFAAALGAGASGPGATVAAGVAPERGAVTPASGGRRHAVIGGALAVAAVVIAAATVWRGAWRSDASSAAGTSTSGDSAASAERSLAVLPFTSVGGDTANSYFAAGIADELTSALMQIPGLRLAGRASAARVKEQGGGANEIGSALNVAAVLDGSVRRSGDRIRVSAELTSARDERVLWSKTYERALADVFAVQDEITREIVSALQVRLSASSGAGGMSARGGTKNLEAYDLYLRALPLYKGRGPGLLQAERYLVDAIARDPGFARAHAMLASTLLAQPYFAPVSARDVAKRGRAAAMRAIALEDSLADGHRALAHGHSEAGEWSAGRREYERAIALDPRSVEAHYRFGEMLFRMGLPHESLDHLEAANRLDPLYSQNNAYRSLTLAMLGRFDEAIAIAERGLTLDPEHLTLNQWYAHVLELAGRRQEMASQARRLSALPEATLNRIGVAAGILARAGARDEARALLRRIEASSVGSQERELAILNARLGLGDLEGAMTALETAAKSDPHRVVAYGLHSLAFDPLRADPRFAAVVRALNLDVDRLTLPDGGRSK
ncbi:MAG: protein kinase [Gemmatimonadetes bacterium]|nr:protein kinase [Gemmatimonadota bacterium]